MAGMVRRKWTDDQLIDAIKNSEYWVDVYDALNLDRVSKSIRKAICDLELDVGHLS